MTSTLDQLGLISPTVKAQGTALDPKWASNLVAVKINRGLSLMSRTTLRFLDPGYALATAAVFALGTDVEVSVGSTSLFKGKVTVASIEDSGVNVPEFVVMIDDAACMLSVSYNIVTYENLQASDIISKLCSASGLQSDVTLPSKAGTYEYLLQQGSDLEFVDTLTRRLNCVWWVEDKTFTVRPAPAGVDKSPKLTLNVAEDLLDFSVRASSLRPLDIAVNGWDANQLQDVVGKSDAGTISPTVQSVFVDPFTGNKPKSALKASALAASDGNPRDQSEAELLADSLHTSLQSQRVVARGSIFVHPELKPMDIVQIGNAGPMNGRYTVTEVEHVYTHRGFKTYFVAGPVRQSVLVDSLATGPSSESGFMHQGLTTATVSTHGTADDQGGDHSGMVKVKYAGGSGALVSAWARVLSFGGGDKRGGVFLPEVNDEVLIGFERGDTRHPVVLGGLFGGKTKLAADDKAVQNGSVDYRRITSRAGHMIEMGDNEAPDKSHVKLALGADGYEMRLGLDRFDIKMPSGKPFAITVGNASIEIDDQGNINIKGMKISIQGQQDVEVKAAMKLTAEGTAGISLQGATAELKGDGTATLQSGGQTAVKGAMVMIN